MRSKKRKTLRRVAPTSPSRGSPDQIFQSEQSNAMNVKFSEDLRRKSGESSKTDRVKGMEGEGEFVSLIVGKITIDDS